MSVIKTCIFSIFLLANGVQASAQPPILDDTTSFFATCAGRMYALMEHQWTVDPAQSEKTQASHMQFASLIDAVTTPAIGPIILSKRVNARLSFRNLLERSYFNDDPQTKHWAQSRVLQMTQECNALLLS